MSMLDIENLGVAYGPLKILKDVSFSLEEGQWLMLVGPNGAGKSTLINAVAGGTAYTGRIRLQGRDITGMRPRERARRVGVLAQRSGVGYAYTVEDVVRLGRYAHGRDPKNAAHIHRALVQVGMEEKRDQSVLTLSGGELQRTFLAQVLAQNPDLLILDEPTNHLDLKYRQQVFELVGKWLQTPGRAVLCVVHDLSLALAYGTCAVLLKEGRVMDRGEPKKVLSRENLLGTYDMDVAAWSRRMLGQWNDM